MEVGSALSGGYSQKVINFCSHEITCGPFVVRAKEVSL
jgi:hypothetical protein